MEQARLIPFVPEQHPDPERHFLVNLRRIDVRARQKSTGGVMGNAEPLAPIADRPACDAEIPSDVLLKNAAGLHTAKQLAIRTAIDATWNGVSLAPAIDRAAADAERQGD